MFLLSTGLAGMARYPMESETKYYWEGTYAQYWCHEYANRFFTESLDNLIIPCDAPLGTDHPEIHMENEKLFFLSRAELEKYLTPDILRLDEDYYLRHDSSSNNLHLKSSNSTVTNISKTLNNTKGTRPAMNLNISKSDLEYDKEELKGQLSKFKEFWRSLLSHFQEMIGFHKDRQYKYVSDDLYKNGIFDDNDNEIANNLNRKVKTSEEIEQDKKKSKNRKLDR
mgnify:CR=1 FL=1